MLYIDKTPLPGKGNSKLWRVFALDAGELRKALSAAGVFKAENNIKALGTPGEHAVVTTTIKNKLRAEEADMRTLVKLIKRKRAAPPLPEPDLAPDPEPDDEGGPWYSEDAVGD